MTQYGIGSTITILKLSNHERHTAMKFNIDQANADRKALVARRAATQAQIRADQASGSKRDAKALRAEASWYAKQAK